MQQREISYAEAPVYMRKLVEAVGTHQAAAVLLGISGGSVGRALSGEPCRLVYEVAAKGVYLEKYAPKNKKNGSGSAVAVLKLPSAHMATVQSLVENLGGSVHVIEG